MRLAVHTDAPYHRIDGAIHGEHAFTLFLLELASRLDGVVAVGRLDPAGGRGRYPLGSKVEFDPLPYYESLIHVRQVFRAAIGSLRRFWRLLARVDAVWLLGPSAMQMGFLVLAVLRRRRVILGVRQDTRAYIANRHPEKRWVRIVAFAMDAVWRGAGPGCPAAGGGAGLPRKHPHAP